MTLLTWPTALIAASIAVPLLLLLYFLKLRRQERKISSTLLWKKAIHDLQVNAPFQKLRRNLLLFLQLLVLLAVLFALAGPIANFKRQPQQNVVLLMDQSGSMKTVEADNRMRIEHAKDAAYRFIDGLTDDSRAMIVGFTDRARVICNFTSDKRKLKRQLEEIEADDGLSKIGEALQLAVAYSSSLIDEKSGGVPGATEQASADLMLFSDGRISDTAEQFVTRARMRLTPIGKATDNVGIVGVSAKRNYERAGILSVFVEIENFGPKPVKSDVSLLVNGKPLAGPGSVREITLGPAAAFVSKEATTTASADERSASRQTVIFEWRHDAGGIVQVKLHREDALMTDNMVYAPVDPPRDVRILAVSDRQIPKFYLDRAFRLGLEIDGYECIGAEEYETADADRLTIDGRSAYDIVILDNHSTDRLPPGNYIFFGGLPKIEGVRAEENDVENQLIVLWNEQHPLLRSIQLDDLLIGRWHRLVLPDQAAPLIEGEDSKVAAFLVDPGHRYIIFAFDLLDSTFMFRSSFPMFMQNAVSYLAAGGLSDRSRLIYPGQTISIPVPAGAREADIRRPDGGDEKFETLGRDILTYAKTDRVGVYRATFDDPNRIEESFAANIADSNESNIVPVGRFTIGAAEIATVEGETEVNEPLWPWAVAAALAILMIEWWIYNRRVMI